ncbi:MAG: M61 family metallopeptidase [Bradymonadia bacterium]
MRHALRHLLSGLILAGLSACDVPTPKAPPQLPPPPAESPKVAVPDTAPSQAPISYTVSFPKAHSHYMEVQAIFLVDEAPTLELMMATWTPGSYLLREYSRHVERFEAFNDGGEALTWSQVAKNRWKIEANGSTKVMVNYRVYGREMSVRTNWVEADFAVLNGAPTFITRPDGLELPHDVKFEMPERWFQSHTGLEGHPSGKAHHYRAADFDTLVDSPVLLGNPSVQRFEVAGKPHMLIDAGLIGRDDRSIWDSVKAATDVAKVVQTQIDFWGQVPYDNYLFLNVLAEAGGGLEHKNSTLMMTSLWATERRKDYLGWLGLVSHEFFHTWNVKRLRPEALGPFDYEHENYTRSLWVAEGVTSYYDDLLLRRADIMTDAEYLKRLSKSIGRVEHRPGRFVQSLGASSFNAWIKHYRPDENSENTAVSYYTRGSLAAFLLDARIQQASGGVASLDDVMRLAYRRYSGERGFTPMEFRKLVNQVAGADLNDFFRDHIDGTQSFNYGPALSWLGLRFKPVKPPKEDDPTQGWLGLHVDDKGGRLIVKNVLRDTPAWQMGLNVGDEIIALDGYRIDGKHKARVLSRYQPGDGVSMLVSRRARMITLDGAFAEAPKNRWVLEFDPEATTAQRRRRTRWLTGVKRPEPEAPETAPGDAIMSPAPKAPEQP